MAKLTRTREDTRLVGQERRGGFGSKVLASEAYCLCSHPVYCDTTMLLKTPTLTLESVNGHEDINGKSWGTDNIF